MRKPALSELTLEEKIGQLLMLHAGFLMKSEEVDENGKHANRDSGEVDAILQKYPYGGVWSFGAVRMDVANLAEMTYGKKYSVVDNRKFFEKLNQNLRIPLLVGMDSESGTGYMFSDGTTTCNSLTMGAANDEQACFELNKSISQEALAAGGNWRWSPVVDMPNRLNGASAGRSYSEDPDQMIRMAIAAIRGTESAGVASTVKHFPGDDGLNIWDSHLVSTVNRLSLEDWEKGQGRIFQEIIDAGVMSVMVGHVGFPTVDDEKIGGKYIPSTVSRKVIQGLLREKMGFKGVVITDAVVMTGLTSLFSYEEMIIRTINAGNDVILGLKPYDMEIVRDAVLDGRIPMERIDESCQRVLDMKEKIGLFKDEKEEIDITQVSRRTAEINRQIAEKSITLLYQKNEILPLSPEKIKKVGIIWSSHSPVPAEEMLATTIEEFHSRGAEVEIRSGNVGKWDIERFDRETDLILYIGYIAPHVPFGMPVFSGGVMQTYAGAFTCGLEKTVGISMGYPYIHLDAMQGAPTFINTYSPSPESQKALVRAMYGEIPFMGSSPVDIEPKVRLVYC